jgi:two-component system response regulator HydG
MRALFETARRVAKTPLSCVLLGETGTGKELLARAIHEHSERASGPFVVVDCGAISRSLIESELFGHERGAFTGADRARAGAFEHAHGGTLFLDEIGEMPLDLQPKLLRALERREVKQLGASVPLDVDVRVLAATHRPLAQMVNERAFRADLYYRLSEVVLEITPLRDRLEDIELLSLNFVEQEARGGAGVRGIAPPALDALRGYSWPGNVRELRNVIRRAVALARSSLLTVADLDGLEPLPDTIAPPSGLRVAADVAADLGTLSLKDARARWSAQLERAYLTALLSEHAGDLARAALTAKVHPKSLRRLLRQHGLDHGDGQ